ncbi:MAG: BlaI/MecI/CopY family transcriptional regulator [Sporichthyaceae bacterium]
MRAVSHHGADTPGSQRPCDDLAHPDRARAKLSCGSSAEEATVRNLGELEAQVMDRIWSSRTPLTVRAILEDLQQTRPLAYTTVLTVLDNLFRKGIVTREPDGRAYCYSAARSREDFAADLVEQALRVSRDRPAAILGFVDRLTPREKARLRKALQAERPRRSTP